MFVNFVWNDVDWNANVLLCWQAVVEIKVFDVKGDCSLVWIGDGFVDEEFDCHEIGCFGSNITHVVDEISANCHSHSVWICFLFSKSGDDTDICGYCASG